MASAISRALEPWREGFLDWRNARLQDPRFIRWAARFPLTRPLARRKTSALFDLVAGFVYTKILTTCVDAKLFDQMVDGPASVAQLSAAIGLDEEATLRLVRGAQALELVEARANDRFGLGELGAALLANPGVLAMIEHHKILYEDLQDPLGLLTSDTPTQLSTYWAYAQAASPDSLVPGAVDDYSALMAASQSFISDEVLDAYPLNAHHHLVDVGGGEGRFVEAALNATASLKATVFDLPAVASRAQARFEQAGLSDRAHAVGGDFFKSQLPSDADIVSLVRIIHDHDDAQAKQLLAAVYSALPVGGTLLLAEPMADTKGAQKAGDAYFGFYLLAMRSGRPRSAQELKRFLQEAGFSNISLCRTATPLLTRVMIAKKA